MTDLIDSILSSMSSKFNDINITNVDITEDKTMKWRGMLNNKYASRRKEKQLERQQQSVSSDIGTTAAPSTHTVTPFTEDNTKISPASDKKMKRVLCKTRTNKVAKKVDLPKRKLYERRSATVVRAAGSANDNEASNAKHRRRTTRLSVAAVSEPDTVPTIAHHTEVSTTGTSSVNTDEEHQTKVENEPDIKAEKESVPECDEKSVPLKQTLKLRRSERTHSNIDTTVCADTVQSEVDLRIVEQQIIEPEIQLDIPSKVEEKPEPIGTPSSDIAPVFMVEIPVETKVEFEINDASQNIPKEELPTESDQPDILHTDASIGHTPMTVEQLLKTPPKRRGRKPGTKLKPKTNAIEIGPVKKSPRLSKDSNNDSVLASAIARREKINEKVATAPPQQRLSRRIKPTAKILANEELRYGFELQNNARLSMSSENLDKTPDELSPKQQTDDGAGEHVIVEPKLDPMTPPLELSPTVGGCETTRRQLLLEQTPPPPNSVKRLLFGQHRSPTNTAASSATSNAVDVFVRPQLTPRRPCPDPVAFLNEIKMAKINLHRSPEDNKKLNVKQKRRLIKLKEKHLNKLGLQKTNKSHADDSSAESNESDDDVEEFVPNKKINVGRPGVTLRLRDKRIASTVIQIIDDTDAMTTSRPNATGTNPIPLLRKPIAADKEKPKVLSRRLETSLLLSTKHKSTLPPSITLPSAIPLATQPAIKQESLPPPTICLCVKPSKYYAQRTDDLLYCRAIDEIETKRIGCCNTVDGDLLNLLRPSVRVSYMTLCENHKQRLFAHNCCAGCGVFCTQGRFQLCKQNHIFHRDCAIKFILNAPFDPQNPDFRFPTLVLKCPHCGQDAPEHETTVTMQCKTMPVFAPSQRHHYTPPAKMTIDLVHRQSVAAAASAAIDSPSLPHRDRVFLLELEKLIPDSVIDLIVRARENFSYTDSVSCTTKDLFYAIHKNDVNRVAEIIATGFDITTVLPEFHNGTCLHLVSNFGSMTMTYLILSRSASVDFLNVVDRQMRSALMCAVVGNRNDVLRLLVQCGADITLKGTDGMSALHLAAKTGNFGAAQIILEHYRRSASAFKYERFLNGTDDGGWTAMVWAAEIGHSDMVGYFVGCGCDPNICDAENNTALHWATMSNSIETVVPLLQSDCDYNVQNINGDTPLHISCRNSNTRICLMLLIRGASLSVKNATGERPYDCIPNESSQCARAVLFNIKIRSVAQICDVGAKSVICQDISNGRELHPIKVIKLSKSFNLATDSNKNSHQNLPDFKYITKTIVLQSGIQIDRRISQMRICSCSDNCTTLSCQCSEISVQNWYNSNGQLNGDFNFTDPAMIFECNDVCGCNKLVCKNRVVQNGMKLPLQIVECKNRIKGWGVFGMLKIPKGSFVAEYTGELITDIEADRRTDDGYFFDLGASEHCIDANYYGNVSRFFNHSCDPNIVPIRVYYEHQDLRFPKIAFFACRDIEVGTELTADV